MIMLTEKKIEISKELSKQDRQIENLKEENSKLKS